MFFKKGIDSLPRLVITAAFACISILTGSPHPHSEASEENSQKTKELVSRLDEKMADISTVSARFVQEKELDVMERTLIIRGQMALQRPQNLAWHVEEPVGYRMIIMDYDLKQWDEDTDRVQSFNLKRNPAYSAVFQQLRAWFSGNYSEMLEEYRLKIIETEPVILMFKPRPETMPADFISAVIITFMEDKRYIEKLKVIEVNESRSTIRFYDTALNEEIEKKMWDARP